MLVPGFRSVGAVFVYSRVRKVAAYWAGANDQARLRPFLGILLGIPRKPYGLICCWMSAPEEVPRVAAAGCQHHSITLTVGAIEWHLSCGESAGLKRCAVQLSLSIHLAASFHDDTTN